MNVQAPNAIGSICEICGTYSRLPNAAPCGNCGASRPRWPGRGFWLAAGFCAVIGLGLVGLQLQRSTSPAPAGSRGSSTSPAPAGGRGSGTEKAPAAPAEVRPEAISGDPRPPKPPPNNPHRPAEPPRGDENVGRPDTPAAPRPKTLDPPKKADALEWANLGATEASQGRLREAEAAYRKALSLEPENWLAHYNFGLLEIRRGQREAAFAHWQRSLRSLDGSNPSLGQKVRRQLAKEPACVAVRGEERFHALVGR